MLVQHLDLHIPDRRDVEHHRRIEGIRTGEIIREVGDHRIMGQVGRIWADRRDSEKVGSILHQLTGRAVVGVVVVRPVRQDEVGAIGADQADQLLSALQGRFETPVGMIPDLIA